MKLKALSLVIFMACSPLLMAQSGMTDQQVLEYAKDGVKQGKDQRTIATELARRGVTREQAERVKKMYEQQTNTGSEDLSGTAKAEARLRQQTQEDNSTLLDEQPQAQEVAQQDAVFGRNIFNTRNLTFEPNVNIATPPNYRLGPGDEVVIDIWGASQNTIRQQISPDGTINLEQLGPVFLSGMSIERAQQYLTGELRKIYSDQSNQIRVTLGNTRTIQINVMGEVIQPGTYALSAFSTVFHALYRAGGVSDIGSLRNVKVSRGGQTVATVDVYQFIMQGKTRDDIRLEEGDVIIVPAYEELVQITGNVKRPMRYEMKKGETLSTLLKYAGGFTSDAYTKSLRIVRQNGKEYQVNTVDDTDYSVCKLHDGDVITAEAILDRFTNKLEVRGAVYRPGIYELGGKLNTVRELVEKADGLMADAFTGRAVLYRERENKTREVKQIDIRAIMDELGSPLTTIPGIGYNMAAMIIAEAGDLSRFETPDKLLAYAGMSPSTYQSGQLKNCYPHMEKRGSRYLRYALYNATKYVCRWDPTFAAYLEKKRSEGKHYNVALSHATKKLVRLIFALERSGEPYRPAPAEKDGDAAA